MQTIKIQHSAHILLQRWLRIDRKNMPGVYAQLYESARISSLSYWLEILFSAAIAVFGLVQNSPAVIIGAMLISPLMGPIMAAGMALAVGDLYLAIAAVTNLMASVSVAVLFTATIVWLLPFHSATAEIIARTNPNLLDLGVAVFSGLAGSFVVCRGRAGGSVTALPGVAIAVALMPPLGTIGFGLGSGRNTEIMGGAGLLFLTNLVAIVSSAFLVFYLVGMSSQEVRAEISAARANDSAARRFMRGPIGRLSGYGGKVGWRILIIAVLLGSVAVPLRRALTQVTRETLARTVVQKVVQDLVPSNALVSQRIQISRESIAIRIISTRNIFPARIRDAEQIISRQTGHRVELTVEEVASKLDLAELTARLATAPPEPAPRRETPLEEFRQEILSRLTPVITAAWPVEAPLESFDLLFNPEGIVCNVRYRAEKDLGEIPLSMIRRDLQQKLNSPDIALHATRVTPPPAPRNKSRS